MTIALNDVKMISDMLAAGRDFVDPVESGKNIAEFLSRRKPLSATMNMQANLLYDVCPFPGIFFDVLLMVNGRHISVTEEGCLLMVTAE